MNSKWEYKLERTVRGRTLEQVAEYLNEQGELGWQLCELDYGSFIFKREKPE